MLGEVDGVDQVADMEQHRGNDELERFEVGCDFVEFFRGECSENAVVRGRVRGTTHGKPCSQYGAAREFLLQWIECLFGGQTPGWSRDSRALFGHTPPMTETLERDFFRALNAFAEPLVRAGFAAPLVAPWGFFVLETKGRRTGQPRRVPLSALSAGETLLCGTFRGSRSQWLQNIEADGAVRYWLRGRDRAGRARRLQPGEPLPAAFAWLDRHAVEAAIAAGLAVVVIEPVEG